MSCRSYMRRRLEPVAAAAEEAEEELAAAAAAEAAGAASSSSATSISSTSFSFASLIRAARLSITQRNAISDTVWVRVHVKTVSGE